jgi:hypothetical protein
MSSMKQATLWMILALALAATSLMAYDNPRIAVNVPFSFGVGNQTLPPGEYVVSLGGHAPVVWIRSADGRHAAVLIAHPTVDQNRYGRRGLSFNRYGDRHFLARVWTGETTGREIPKSRAEKEYIAARQPAQAVLVLAAMYAPR